MNSLHDKIMNIPCNTSRRSIGASPLMSYQQGHRDARHAAAELASHEQDIGWISVDDHVKWMKDALETICDWADYASPFFQEKHDLLGDIERYKAEIEKHLPPAPDNEAE